MHQFVRLHSMELDTYNGMLGSIKRQVLSDGSYSVLLYDNDADLNEISPHDDSEHELIVKPENLLHACFSCFKCISDPLFCGGCKTASYCNSECQLLNWKGAHT